MVHHVIGGVVEFARHRRRHRPHLQAAAKLDASIDLHQVYAVQPGQEVKMPKGATILTIRDGLQANLFLHTDDLADRAVFDLA